MGKVKIYEIAKELNMNSKEILDVATSLGFDVKNHLSTLDENQIKKIKKELEGNKGNKKDISNNKESGKGNHSKNENKQPVIIRREVIISNENEVKEEKNAKKDVKRNNIGFVERKNNKDFNIVYRNKATKPMSVSELFGLKKEEKEEKKSEEIKKENHSVDVKKENNAKPINDKKQYATDKIEKTFETKKQQYNNKPKYDKSNNNNVKDKFNNNYQNRRNQNKNGFNDRKTLDDRGIDKNIKDIMAADTVEKESVKSYNRMMDRQKNSNKNDETRTKKTKSKKSNDMAIDEKKLKNLKQSNKLSNMFNDQDGGMLDYYDLTTARGRRAKKKNNKNIANNKQKIFQLTEITIPETITVKNLATELKKTTAEIIKKLLDFGIMATLNNDIDFDTAYLIAQEFNVTAIKKEEVKEEDILFDESEDKEEELKTRPPVVVVMGHVDHGKTSLLDAVKKTNVIGGEAGGITQHIGAYKVQVGEKEITFLDTPGHEAFTAMRARGAQITDIAILVVAANDGVKPQTIEAIDHAKSANTPIIVAINKIDLPDANIEKVKQEMMQYELVPEEWGGDTIFVPISAKKNENIDQLLEMVLLEAEMLELKANPKKQAKGVVIEARLDKSKGPIATLLVQRGTLDEGDTIVVGSSIGRIRSMKNDKGKRVKSAGPSTPVSISGLAEVPEGGDIFYEVKDEKMAKHLIERRKRQAREKKISEQTKITLDNLFSKMEEENLKVLNLIVKADVQGSVEAVKQSLEKLSNDKVKVKVIHAAAGAVNQSDITLAKVSNAIIIAFNVRPDNMAKELAEKDEIEIKQYSIIYQAIEDVELAMKGMLDPEYEEKVIGNAEVREVFKISNVGTIAGAFVLNGKVERNAGVRVIRENVVIHEGKILTLKRFKDDAKEVSKGFECGIQIEEYNDIKEGDIIEAYIMEEIKR